MTDGSQINNNRYIKCSNQICWCGGTGRHRFIIYGRVVELEYTSDLSSAAERIEGSNPSTLTNGSTGSIRVIN